MPDKYPDAILTIRFSSKSFNDEKLQKELDEQVLTISDKADEGELYVSEVIEWINENLDRFKFQEKPKSKNRTNLHFGRYW